MGGAPREEAAEDAVFSMEDGQVLVYDGLKLGSPASQ